jgi:TonB family protein
MFRKTLITLLFAAFYCLNTAQGQSKMDCSELKKRIDDAFKNYSTLRTNYWSEEDKMNIQFEQDSQSNNHLVFSKTRGSYDVVASITIKDKNYYTKLVPKPDAEIKWGSVSALDTDFPKWTNICKSASSVLDAPFKNCVGDKQKSVAGTVFSIYSVEVSNDTFDVWINNSTDKLEKINTANSQKKLTYSWVFNEPFRIKAPIDFPKNNRTYGTTTFPPTYTYEEHDGTERVCIFADNNSEYRTGQLEMFKFLGNTMKYPKRARENGVEGTIYLGFVVEKDGTLTNIKVKRGVNSDLNEEAIRVLKLMNGNWKPAMIEGQNVRQAFTLPIKFRLD